MEQLDSQRKELRSVESQLQKKEVACTAAQGKIDLLMSEIQVKVHTYVYVYVIRTSWNQIPIPYYKTPSGTFSIMYVLHMSGTKLLCPILF